MPNSYVNPPFNHGTCRVSCLTALCRIGSYRSKRGIEMPRDGQAPEFLFSVVQMTAFHWMKVSARAERKTKTRTPHRISATSTIVEGGGDRIPAGALVWLSLGRTSQSKPFLSLSPNRHPTIIFLFHHTLSFRLQFAVLLRYAFGELRCNTIHIFGIWLLYSY